jgi:hypothetical protein
MAFGQELYDEDIQFEGQSHSNADPTLNGAVHFSGDVSWWTDGTLLFITTPAGPFVLPAAPGHYGGPQGRVRHWRCSPLP